MRPRVLVVEDEPAIADTIVYALATEGFEPVWCATGKAALEAARLEPAALAILDVGLPDINGFELFRQLQRTVDLPAIFLTARSSEIDRVVGLELGADDYMAKPFSPRELVARVRTVLRRVERTSQKERSAKGHPFEIDDERKSIRFRGQVLDSEANGVGSAGKGSIAKALQTITREPFLHVAMDEFLDMLPETLWGHPDGIVFTRLIQSLLRILPDRLQQSVAARLGLQSHH
jgi:two-component system catabolic regulation response regulator CreB